jgi:hypothetical protein
VLTGQAQGESVTKLQVNNSTYAYLSLKDGDQFTKKFGGEDGNDPDFFLLTIKKYLDGELSTVKVEFYLADFRFDDNSMDYIVNEWTEVDLTSLGQTDSLSFSLTSSDNGQFGMNTPAYFCIDNVETVDGPVATEEYENNISAHVFPNPTRDYIHIRFNNTDIAHLIIYNMMGQEVLSKQVINGEIINIEQWRTGQYFGRLIVGQSTDVFAFIKE